MATKTCGHCKEKKALQEFSKHAGRPDGYRWECKECSKAKRGAWYSRNREAVLRARRRSYHEDLDNSRARVKRSAYVSKHGITQEEANELIEKQGGLCGLCGEPMEGLGRGKYAAVYDHCHATGKHRAMIHSRCNCMIGFSEDSPSLLRKAASYLETHHA